VLKNDYGDRTKVALVPYAFCRGISHFRRVESVVVVVDGG
jgi:hypothetical protein